MKETSKLLGINKNKVYDLIKTENLRAIKLNNLKIPSSEIENFIEANKGHDLSDLRERKKLYI